MRRLRTAALLLLAGCSKSAGSSSAAATPAAAPPVAQGVSSRADASISPAGGVLASDGGDAQGASRRPPQDLDVVLITVDSLRADMPWAGYPRPIAPRLTELEKGSVSFTHAYSISSYTSMSLGGLLGGKLPGELKRDGFFFGTYPKQDLFFPELLQAAHIHTVAAQAHGYFKDPTFAQGFDRWLVVPDITFKNTTDENITSPRQEGLAEKLLGDPAVSGGDARFFAWFHFMDPHDQYKSHEPEVPPWGRTLRDRYDGEVTFTDKYLGKLLDFIAAQPWGARTAVILSADHGEAFGEHGQYQHGFELWENLVRVPLFFRVPGAAPRRIDVATSDIDLAPTILDLFGLPPESTFEGESLVPVLYGAEPKADRDIVLDLPATSDSDRRRAIIHGSLKLIAFGDDKFFQLFDIGADPTEEHPITKGDDYAAMVARYRALEARVQDVPAYGCKEDCLNGAYHKKDAGGGAP